MKKINMVDLNGQYRKIRWQVNREIKKVINSSSFINGPIVKDFQNNLQEYLNVRHVIPCANGTDALQIALMALNLKRGDEIITTNFSFASTIEVILLLGLKPVVVDIDPKTFNINPSLIQDKITERTKAIIPVHLFGQSCRMEEILEIANKNNLQVIEDNAQALGSTYKFSNSQKQMSGTIGDIATTSFFPSKNLGCYGDGGAIFTNSDSLAYKMRGIVNHGMYERYYHDEIGVNSRLDSIQAAILNVKLKYLDKYNKRRQEAASLYNNSFDRIDEIEVPFVESDIDSHVYHQYTLKIQNGKRDELADHLQKNNVPFGIYYPLGFHEQKAYKQEFISDIDFPETNKVKDQVISLPMHTELTKKQINFITNTITSFFE